MPPPLTLIFKSRRLCDDVLRETTSASVYLTLVTHSVRGRDTVLHINITAYITVNIALIRSVIKLLHSLVRGVRYITHVGSTRLFTSIVAQGSRSFGVLSPPFNNNNCHCSTRKNYTKIRYTGFYVRPVTVLYCPYLIALF